jgi:hypothetical protein
MDRLPPSKNRSTQAANYRLRTPTLDAADKSLGKSQAT